LNAGYSHRGLAKQAGLSFSFPFADDYQRIEKSFRSKTIPKFSDGLKLNNKEKRYFELMVLYNQTDDLQMKAKYFSEIIAVKGAMKGLHSLEKEKFDFLSKWYVVAIYVLVDLKILEADPNWIAKRLGGLISTSQAKASLENLQKLGMIEPDAAKVFAKFPERLTVADDTKSMAVLNITNR